MRWGSLGVLIMLAVAAGVGGAVNPSARAQDATPASEQATETTEGIDPGARWREHDIPARDSRVGAAVAVRGDLESS